MKILIAVIIGVVVLAGAIVGVGLAFRPGSFGRPSDVTVVRYEPAARGALVEMVSVPGEIQPEDPRKISARVPAQILDLPHKEGDAVTAYDPRAGGPATQPSASSILVVLDAKDLKAALDSAEARSAAQGAEVVVAETRIKAQEATIRASQVTLADAERELGRQQTLLKSQDVSQQTVDQAETKVAELRNTLESARQTLAAETQNLLVLKHHIDASKADIDRAREQLAYTVITSPINGTIVKINNKVGETVVPGIQGQGGSVILEVADLNRMRMIARVDEATVAQVSKANGARATVRMQAYRERVFTGTVESVAMAKADPSSMGGMQMRGGGATDGGNFYEARILLDTKGERIFCGLNADADIEIKRHEGIRVPSQAVLGRAVDTLPEALRKREEVEQGKQFTSVVYRLVDGKAVVTPVKVGPSDETHTLILSGLKEGEPVIVGPYKILDALQNDQKVKGELAPPTAQKSSAAALATQPATGAAATQPASVATTMPAAGAASPPPPAIAPAPATTSPATQPTSQ